MGLVHICRSADILTQKRIQKWVKNIESNSLLRKVIVNRNCTTEVGGQLLCLEIRTTKIRVWVLTIQCRGFFFDPTPVPWE